MPFIYRNGQVVEVGSPVENDFTFADGDLIDDGEDSEFAFIRGRGLGPGIPEGIFAYWPLNEGGGEIAFDLGPDSYDADFQGSPTWVDHYDDPNDHGVEFDGSDDYIRTPMRAGTNLTRTFLTVTEYYDTGRQYHGTWGTSINGGDGRFYMGVRGSSEFQWGFGATWERFDLDYPLNEPVMHVMTATEGEDEVFIYQNTERVYEADAEFDIEDWNEVWLGAINDTQEGSWTGVNGVLYQARIYDRYLPEDEVNDIFEDLNL